jgi:hypothetical protein
MLGFFNKSSPAEEMKRAVAAYEKVSSLKSDSHDARIVRMRMGMLCRAHLDKTFIAGAEQTALWTESNSKLVDRLIHIALWYAEAYHESV